MAVSMPPLPYDKKALSPYISEQTLEFHYGKHHKGYVDKLNAQIQGQSFDKASLEEIVKNSQGGLFNLSAQAWNHEFYWNCLSAPSQNFIPKELQDALEKDFGSVETFQSQFTKEALAHFGSGWAWLVRQDSKLQVISTHDADTPLAHGAVPLMTCDVWEHAYYLDYQNNRAKYVENFWKIINWNFIYKNYSS
ncbi:MAG: superoxide dismutase [Bdellovibrionales bacterium]|nr:superoxide dismutase [Bdellovibrionales bacterium]